MQETSTDPARPTAMTSKSPDAFRTISEVAEELDVPAHVLRFWESKFTQVHPIKRGGGRRYYRPEDINLLKGIRDLLYKDGLTIKGVQKVLRDQGAKKVAAAASAQAATEPEQPAAAPPVAIPASDPFPAAAQPALFPESADTVPLRLERKIEPAPLPPKGGELAEIIRALELLRDKMRQ